MKGGRRLRLRCLKLAKTILVLCEIFVTHISPRLTEIYSHNFISLWKKCHWDFSRNKQIVGNYSENTPKLKDIDIDTCCQWCLGHYKVSMSSMKNSKQKQI